MNAENVVGADLGLILVREHLLMPDDNPRLLDWIEILALEVLLCADRQHAPRAG